MGLTTMGLAVWLRASKRYSMSETRRVSLMVDMVVVGSLMDGWMDEVVEEGMFVVGGKDWDWVGMRSGWSCEGISDRSWK